MMMDEWESERKDVRSTDNTFCSFLETESEIIGSAHGKLSSEIAESVSKLIEGYSPYESINGEYEFYVWSLSEIQSAVSQNIDHHPALAVLSEVLISMLQLESELSLVREAVEGCRSGIMLVQGMPGSNSGNPTYRYGLHRLFRNLAGSGVNDFSFWWSRLPMIDFSDLKLGRITIRESVIAGLNFTNSSLESLTIEQSVMVRCLAPGRCNGQFQFKEAEISGSVILDRVDVSGSLNFSGAHIGRDFRFSKVNINRLEATRQRLGRDDAWDFDLLLPERDALLSANEFERKGEGASLWLFAGEVGGTTSIYDSEFSGKVHFGRSRHGELRLAGTHFDGKFDLWGATISGPAFLGHEGDASVPGVTVTGQFNAWYANFDDLQIEYAWIGDELRLHHARIDGSLHVSNSELPAGLRAGNLRSNSIQLDNLASSSVYLRASSINGELSVIQSNIGSLDIVLSQMRGLSYFDAYDEAKVLRPKSECLAPPTKSSNPPRFGISDGGRKPIVSHRRPNCSGTIQAHSAIILNGAYLSGYLESQIDFTQAQVRGTTNLSSGLIAYGASTCILMRDADLQSVILDPPGVTADKRGERTPKYIDMYGAQFDLIRASEPVLIVDREKTARSTINLFHLPDGMACGLEGLVEKDPSASSDASVPLPPRYLPGVYDALATGYEAAGDVDMARIVKIEKNRAYAAGLEQLSPSASLFLERAVYTISDWINGFGYRNIKAVIWLLGLVSTGYVLSWIAVKRDRSANELPGAMATARIHETNIRRVHVNRFMFSLDRAIPTLGLDTSFGTHADKPMPAWLSLWFYVQRVACFVIIILMIAGAFEVFQ
jgi:uncharacterized protein YjbI with pentapeptide repeats